MFSISSLPVEHPLSGSITKDRNSNGSIQRDVFKWTHLISAIQNRICTVTVDAPGRWATYIHLSTNSRFVRPWRFASMFHLEVLSESRTEMWIRGRIVGELCRFAASNSDNSPRFPISRVFCRPGGLRALQASRICSFPRPPLCTADRGVFVHSTRTDHQVRVFSRAESRSFLQCP